MPLPVTVLIPAKNEAANIEKCLESIRIFAHRIVIDSQSTDDSRDIVESHGATLVQFDNQGSYPKKRQWALDTLQIETPWILLMDADEEMTLELEAEIGKVVNDPSAKDAYVITKGFHFMRKEFRFGGFSHAAVLLFKTGKARFEEIPDVDSGGLDMEVHERLLVDGSVGRLKNPLIHRDFKGLHAYIDRHNRYSSWEADVRSRMLDGKINENELKPTLFGNVQQRRRWLKKVAIRIPCEPWLWFCYHYFMRLGILEGRRGLIASQIRAQYINNVRAKMYEKRTRG